MSNKMNSRKTTAPFTESGTHDDEVTLVFDDNQELYVSLNFLCLASPVFKAMFDSGFKEKQENCVKLPSKKYHDIREFLMCLHPAVQKEVTETNVLLIVPIAEEYQVTSIVSKCKNVMKSWLQKAARTARRKREVLRHLQPLRECLLILAMADLLNYEDVVSTAVEKIGRFRFGLYNLKGHLDCYQLSLKSKVDGEVLGDIRKECVIIFEKFNAELRCKILSERVLYKEDDSSDRYGYYSDSYDSD